MASLSDHCRDRICRYALAGALAWTVLVALSALWNIGHHRASELDIAREVAEAYFRKDQAMRFWGARHGGVYVPITDETPPNEYLDVPEREIETPSGRRLTLMNPAYMMRQINEDFAGLYGIGAHLTSLKPLRPTNTPDPWERKALEAFERGEESRLEVVERDGAQYLRLMRPLIARAPCLKCHEQQGYKDGDVRGGLSVTLPLAGFRAHARVHERAMVLSHLFYWLVGVAVLGLVARRSRRWIAERERGRAQLELAHRYTRDVVASVGEGLYGVDREGRLTFMNPAAAQLLGWSEAELLGRSVHEAIHHAHADGTPYPQSECPLLAVVTTGEPYASDDDVFVRRDGSLIPVAYVATPIRTDDGDGGAVIAFQDISERRRNESRIRHLAHHDALTDLPNRTLLLELLEHSVAQAQRYGHALAVLFVDLDDFSLVNDTLGHAQGDELLRQLGERLRAVVREPDVLARQGGDEFILLLYDPSSVRGDRLATSPHSVADHAVRVARRLLAALEAPFPVGGQDLTVSACIGISLFPEDAPDGETLLRHADSAMYHAKALGNGGVAVFAGELSERLERRRSIEISLHQAMANGEIQLHYQPLVRITDRVVVGFEALLRWHSPEHGNVSPAEFIPIAEANGLIVPLGEWVLREACAQVADWRQQGADVYVAVNISLRQFLRGGLEDTVRGAIEECGIPPDALELEITESTAAYDPAQAAEVLRALHDGGLRLALDDFGTGYSSLSRLKQLPISTLKVDKSFVDGVPEDPDDVQIVGSTVRLAHGLGKQSLAEGVETEQQHRFLLSEGCRLGQGYLYGRPMPAEQAGVLLGLATPRAALR